MRFVLLLVFLSLASSANAESIRLDFNSGLTGWEEKVFGGRVDYQLVMDEGRQILQADSRGNASAMIYWIDIDPQQYPTLRWRWKIDQVLAKGHAGLKEGDDYPARIYIVFDAWLPIYARSINYIWASRVERDTVTANPYYRRSMMLAVESGAEKAGEWLVEERSLVVDYQRIFGKKAPRIKAVAVMSDGDDTGEDVRAWFDWIEFVPAAP